MKARIGFKIQVAAKPGFHWLYDRCHQTIWLFSGERDHPEDGSARAVHGAEALYSAVKRQMYAIWTEYQEAQQDEAHRMLHSAKPGRIRRWSDSELANWQLLARILLKNLQRVDVEWTDNDPAIQKTLVDRFTRQGATGAWRVKRCLLACFSLVLRDMEDRNNISGKWNNEWPLDSWVDSPISQWLREPFLHRHVNEALESPESNQDNASRERLCPKHVRHEHTLPSTPPQMGVLFCPLSGQVHDLEWWRMKCFADGVVVFHIYADIGKDDDTEMQRRFQYSQHPSVFITAPTVGGTGLTLTAGNSALVTHKFWVLHQQRQTFPWVVQLRQKWVLHSWLLCTGLGDYDNHPSDHHQFSGVVQMKVPHGFMSWPNIPTSVIYQILESYEYHMKRLPDNGDSLESDEASS